MYNSVSFKAGAAVVVVALALAATVSASYIGGNGKVSSSAAARAGPPAPDYDLTGIWVKHDRAGRIVNTPSRHVLHSPVRRRCCGTRWRSAFVLEVAVMIGPVAARSPHSSYTHV